MHCVLELGIGGLQRLISEMTMAMDRDVFDVEVCCYDGLGCFADSMRAQGIPVTLLQKNQKRFDPFYPFRLAAYMRKRKPDIVQMHSGSWVFGVIAARLARVPVTVYTDHGRALVEEKVRLVEDRISAVLGDQIIAVSKELEVYLAEVVKLPPKKIRTVINGLPTKTFAPRPKSSALLAEFNIPADCAVLGTVARLDGVKDQLSMIRAFELVHQQQPNSRLIIVGDGPLRASLTDYITAHKLEGRVIITGERRDVPALLNLFDLFLLSSLSEGTSVSVLEAMSSGVTPIVTNVGGNPSIVKHSIDGIVVEPADPAAMANAALALLENADLRRTMAGRAVAKVREEYSIDTMVRKYVDIYIEHLARKRRSRHLVRDMAVRMKA